MKIEEASGTRGAEALLAYIRAEYGSIPSFCDATGLDRIRVQKAIRGEIKRIDADFAFAMQRATHGAVSAELWTQPLEKDEPPASDRQPTVPPTPKAEAG